MRFLVDMNLSPRWVDFLAAAGHEAVHWIDVGEPNAPDRVILGHAHRSGQVILTQDLDFGTLLAAIDVVSIHLEAGALVTVDPVGHRVTVLPISMSGA
jgi:predicted nuclease of predicted toxin-antitoxin system